MINKISSYCYLVTQPCPTLCDPMDCSTPYFPILHHLLEFSQTPVHWVGNAIQHLILCHPLIHLPSIFPSIRVCANESALCIRLPKQLSRCFINWMLMVMDIPTFIYIYLAVIILTNICVFIFLKQYWKKFCLFLTVLRLCCYVRTFTSCSSQASHFWWFLLLRSTGLRALASLTVAHGLSSYVKVKKVKVKSLSRVRLFVTPWTVAYQAPPFHGILQARILE